MSILITGSAGHLGEALMRVLRASGDDPIGVDLKPSPFTTIVGSIVDRALVKRCMTGPEAYADVYERLGWKMFAHIDRVYVNDRARAQLGWSPRYDFAR